MNATPVQSRDGTLLTDKCEIIQRSVEYFQSVLNQHSNFVTFVFFCISRLTILRTASDCFLSCLCAWLCGYVGIYMCVTKFVIN